MQKLRKNYRHGEDKKEIPPSTYFEQSDYNFRIRDSCECTHKVLGVVKRIIFTATNRAHLARQSLLIEELKKCFEVDVFVPKTKMMNDLEAYSIFCAVEFKNFIKNKQYDLSIIRADRYELLHIAGRCAYLGIPIAHIEGGSDSGDIVIDTRVRNAISQLADFHFVTDEQARRNVARLTGSQNVWNVGSLDVSLADNFLRNDLTNVKTSKAIPAEEYILFLHHEIPNESTKELYNWVQELGLKIVGVKSNNDYAQSLFTEEYSPEQFIVLIRLAKVIIGNSSAICKEASILGTPCVLTGERQRGRLAGHNVIRVPHNEREFFHALEYQLRHGRYKPDMVYYKRFTEKKICKIIKKFLQK